VSLKIALNSKGGNVVNVAQAYSTDTSTTTATPDRTLGNNMAWLNTAVIK